MCYPCNVFFRHNKIHGLDEFTKCGCDINYVIYSTLTTNHHHNPHLWVMAIFMIKKTNSPINKSLKTVPR